MPEKKWNHVQVIALPTVGLGIRLLAAGGRPWPRWLWAFSSSAGAAPSWAQAASECEATYLGTLSTDAGTDLTVGWALDHAGLRLPLSAVQRRPHLSFLGERGRTDKDRPDLRGGGLVPLPARPRTEAAWPTTTTAAPDWTRESSAILSMACTRWRRPPSAVAAAVRPTSGSRSGASRAATRCTWARWSRAAC